MRKYCYKATAVFLMALIIMGGFSVWMDVSSYCDIISRDDIDSLEKHLEDIRLKIDENEKALSSIKNEQSYTQSAVTYTLSLIDSYTLYCETLNVLIGEYDVEMERTKEEIAKHQKEFDRIYPEYISRLQSKKEDVRVTAIELVLKSASLADFIISVERANEAVRYDRELLSGINEQKSQLEQKMSQLLSLQQNRQKQIESCEIYKVEMAKRVEELYAYLEELDSSYDAAEQERLLWEKLEKEADNAVKELIDAYNKQNASMPSYALGEEMAWPLDTGFNYISSKYGYRTHPITGEKYSFHGAIDIPAPENENIYAALSGVVVTATYNSSYGNYIIIDHGIVESKGERLFTLYSHANTLLVSAGDKVSQGDIIAKVGKSGSADGFHLHFEVRMGDDKKNPLDYVKKP